MMEELRSWWEVPAIAHFFSLFKSCFSITDFTIEELEEALLADSIDERSTYFTSQLLSELLQGCYDNPNITVTTCHDWLRQIMRERWEEQDKLLNPLSVPGSDFHNLPTRLKVQIIHRLTEYRLDGQDVATKLTGLNPSDLRLDPLGSDRNGSRYWYFFGVRLYKEERVPVTDKNHNKCKKGRIHGRWSVVCYNVGDWKTLAKSLKGSTSRKEKQLRQLVKENFLPNLPKIVEDMERQQQLKLQTEPKRSSCRILAKKICQEEMDAEAVRNKQKEEALYQERVEHNRLKREKGGERVRREFNQMIRFELERKWRNEERKRLNDNLEQHRVLIEDGNEPDLSSSDEEPVVNKDKHKQPVKPIVVKPKVSEAKRRGPKKKPEHLKKTRKVSKHQSSSEEESDHIEELQDKMNEIVQVLLEHPESWQFASPVEEWYAPGYHGIIKRPMDLATVEKKIKEGGYNDLSLFVNDVELMFSNCRLYNGPESEYTEVANEMDNLFHQNVKKILPAAYKFVKTVPEKPTQSHSQTTEESVDSDGELHRGATTRATWRELTTTTSNATTAPKVGRPRGGKRKAASTRGRKKSNQSTQPIKRGRGRPTRRSIAVESSQSNDESSEDNESVKEAATNDISVLSKHDIDDKNSPQDVEMEQKEEEPNKNKELNDSKNEDIDKPATPKPSSPKKMRQRSPSSSSSRGSSLDKFNQLEQESRTRPQVVWSLDFLASQARVLEEQQSKQKGTPEPRKNETPKQSCKSDEERGYQAYPMTPGFHRPDKESRRVSQDSPPTPSSGYSSYRPQGMSGPPSLNPPTPKLAPVEENRLHNERSRTNAVTTNQMRSPESRLKDSSSRLPKQNSVDRVPNPLHLNHMKSNNNVPNQMSSSREFHKLSSTENTPQSVNSSNQQTRVGSNLADKKNVPDNPFNHATPPVNHNSLPTDSRLANNKHDSQMTNNHRQLNNHKPVTATQSQPPVTHERIQHKDSQPSPRYQQKQTNEHEAHYPLSRSVSSDPQPNIRETASGSITQHNTPSQPRPPEQQTMPNQRRLSENQQPPIANRRASSREQGPNDENKKRNTQPSHPTQNYQQSDQRLAPNESPATPTIINEPNQSTIQRRNSGAQRSNRGRNPITPNRLSQPQQSPAYTPNTNSRYTSQRNSSTQSMHTPYSYSKSDNPTTHRLHDSQDRTSHLTTGGSSSQLDNNPIPGTAAGHQQYDRNHEAHDMGQSVAASIFLNNHPTMSSLGLNWKLTPQQTHGGSTEHHKSPHAAMYDPISASHSSSVQSQDHMSSSAQSKKRSTTGYQSNDYYPYAGQQGTLLPGSNPLLHHTEIAASARLSRVFQQQHNADGSMLMQTSPYGTSPSTAEQYRLAQAQQHHPLGMYHHQSSTATPQNPWGLAPHLAPPHIDPVYQHLVYRNLLHKY